MVGFHHPPLAAPVGVWVNCGVLQWGWYGHLYLFPPAHGDRDRGVSATSLSWDGPQGRLGGPKSLFPALLLSPDVMLLLGDPFWGRGMFAWGPCHRWLWAPRFGVTDGGFGGGGGDRVGCRRRLAQPCCDGAGLGCSVQMQSLCSLPIVRYQEPQEEDGLEDMTQLE